jgi:hypothetical protein
LYAIKPSFLFDFVFLRISGFTPPVRQPGQIFLASSYKQFGYNSTQQPRRDCNRKNIYLIRGYRGSAEKCAKHAAESGQSTGNDDNQYYPYHIPFLQIIHIERAIAAFF